MTDFFVAPSFNDARGSSAALAEIAASGVARMTAAPTN
jgi:hypothetical protein